jgi:hypothetical protein
MICPRYISAVSDILEQLEIPFASIQLGKVILLSSLDAKTIGDLSN